MDLVSARSTRIIVGVCLVIVLGVVAWIANAPPAPRPNVSITFAGYTNDSTGNRLARFAVSNLEKRVVFRAPHHDFQIQSSSGWTREWAGLFPAGAMLRPGGSEVIALAPPTNRAIWKLSLVFTPRASAGEVKWMGTLAMMKMGLPTRFRVMRYELESNEVDAR